MKTQLIRPASSGFSLIEVLMVIAIIGIVAAIAIPHVNSAETARIVRDRRHAQELSSFTVAAQAAGLDLVVPGDITATLQKVLAGGSPTTGSFRGCKFIAPKMALADAQAAARFLKVEAGSLVYSYDGYAPSI